MWKQLLAAATLAGAGLLALRQKFWNIGKEEIDAIHGKKEAPPATTQPDEETYVPRSKLGTYGRPGIPGSPDRTCRNR